MITGFGDIEATGDLVVSGAWWRIGSMFGRDRKENVGGGGDHNSGSSLEMLHCKLEQRAATAARSSLPCPLAPSYYALIGIISATVPEIRLVSLSPMRWNKWEEAERRFGRFYNSTHS